MSKAINGATKPIYEYYTVPAPLPSANIAKTKSATGNTYASTTAGSI